MDAICFYGLGIRLYNTPQAPSLGPWPLALGPAILSPPITVFYTCFLLPFRLGCVVPAYFFQVRP